MTKMSASGLQFDAYIESLLEETKSADEDEYEEEKADTAIIGDPEKVDIAMHEFRNMGKTKLQTNGLIVFGVVHVELIKVTLTCRGCKS